LTCLARRDHRFSSEPLFNQGRETRDLGFVVLSRGTGTYLNFHCVLQVGSGGFWLISVISINLV